MTTDFQTPWFALLFLPLVSGIWTALRRRPPALLVSETTHLAAAGGKPQPALGVTAFPILIYGLGTACLIMALMRPRAGIERTEEQHEGIDIVLLLDISGSMESYDIPEQLATDEAAAKAIADKQLEQRIAIAKRELSHFVEQRPHDRIALTVFSQKPYLACPPTLDHRFLLDQLDRLEAGMLPDGTSIAAALASAANRLRDSTSRRKVCVLFTDGKDNVKDRITPRQAADAVRRLGIITHTVGIGSKRAMLRTASVLGIPQLRPVPASLDIALLRDVAERTGGTFSRAEDAAGFAAAMEQIDKLETVQFKQTTYMDYHERFMPWLLAGLVLLLVGAVLDNTCCQRVP